MSFNRLSIGNSYSKNDLSEIFSNPNIKLIREGIYNVNSSESMFFVDLEKKGKEDRFHFDDFFEEDFFHWDSQTTQHINTPKIKEIVQGSRIPHLFVRLFPKVKSTTQPFIYCGRLKYIRYEEGTSKPVHIIFQNIDYQDNTNNKKLIDIYTWKPRKIGKNSKTNISMEGVISPERIKNYIKPNKTERKGLVTSRVGQGYYRHKLLEKWNYECALTGCKVLSILIASHIVPWSECDDIQRLDVNNGILLSPDVDALFDKNLISFTDDGALLLSDKLDKNEIDRLGIPLGIKIYINEEMKPYLLKHRLKMYGNH